MTDFLIVPFRREFAPAFQRLNLGVCAAGNLWGG